VKRGTKFLFRGLLVVLFMYLLVGIFGYLTFYHTYSVSDFPQVILQAHYGFGNVQVILVIPNLGYFQHSHHGSLWDSAAGVPLPGRHLLRPRVEQSHTHSHPPLLCGFQYFPHSHCLQRPRTRSRGPWHGPSAGHHGVHFQSYHLLHAAVSVLRQTVPGEVVPERPAALLGCQHHCVLVFSGSLYCPYNQHCRYRSVAKLRTSLVRCS